ncbi:unnamed protein product [Rhizophagus irregularis]|nr:unnamed protein product [Rhizophagus irregularis]
MKVILPIKSFDTHSVTINDDDNGDESQQDISEIEFEEEVGNVGDRISIRLSEDGRNVELFAYIGKESYSPLSIVWALRLI